LISLRDAWTLLVQDTGRLFARADTCPPTDGDCDPFEDLGDYTPIAKVRQLQSRTKNQSNGSKGMVLVVFALAGMVCATYLAASKVITGDQWVGVVCTLAGLIGGFVIGKKT